MDVNTVPQVVVIEEFWLTFLIATVLPIIVALVTKRLASPSFKSLVLVALSIVNGVLTSAQANGGTIELRPAMVGFFVSFVTAVGIHFGLLAPNGVTGANGAIARAVPKGLG